MNLVIDEGLDGPHYLDSKGYERPAIEDARSHFESLVASSNKKGCCSYSSVPLSLYINLNILTLIIFCLGSGGSYFIFDYLITRDKVTMTDPLYLSMLSYGNTDNDFNSWIVTAVVGGTMSLFLVVLFIFSCCLQRSTRNNEVCASDYSIYVTGLPSTVTVDEVRDHFSGLYNLRVADWTYSGSSCCWIGRKTAKWARPTYQRIPEGTGQKTDLPDQYLTPVLDARNTGSAGYLRSWVADVTLATTNRHRLHHEKLADKIRNLRARVKYLRDDGSDLSSVQAKQLLNKLAGLERRLALKRDASLSRMKKEKVVGAFVIFNNAESLRRCLDDYAATSGWSWFLRPSYWLQPHPLRFLSTSSSKITDSSNSGSIISKVGASNKIAPLPAVSSSSAVEANKAGSAKPTGHMYRLRVRQADEPSDVLHEHLSLSWWHRIPRLFLSFFLALVPIAAALIGAVALFMLHRSFVLSPDSNAPSVAFCEEIGLNAFSFSSIVSEHNLRFPTTPLVPTLTHLSPAETSALGLAGCTDQELPLVWTVQNGTDRLYSDLQVEGAPPAGDSCYNVCVDVSGSSSSACTGVPAASEKVVFNCFCALSLRDSVKADGLVKGTRHFLEANEFSRCNGYIVDFLLLSLLPCAAAVWLVLCLALARRVAHPASLLAGLRSRSASARCQLILSGLAAPLILLGVPVILFADLSSWELVKEQVFSGTHAAATALWLQDIGPFLFLVLALEALLPPLATMLAALAGMLSRCCKCCASNYYSRELLLRAAEPKEFPLLRAISRLLGFLCCALLAFPVFPLLLPLAAAFLLLELLSTACEVRVRAPPFARARTPLFLQVDALRPLSDALLLPVILGLLMATWTLGAPSVLPSEPLFNYTLFGVDLNHEVPFSTYTFDETTQSGSWAVGNNSRAFDPRSDVELSEVTLESVLLRVSRVHTLPLFLFALVLLLAVVLTILVGLALPMLAGALHRCSRGKLCPFEGSGPLRPAITAKSAYTGAYRKPLNPRLLHTLSAEQQAQGFRLSQEGLAEPVPVLQRVWTDSGRSDGVSHKAGERMLTWQVVAAATGSRGFAPQDSDHYRRVLSQFQRLLGDPEQGDDLERGSSSASASSASAVAAGGGGGATAAKSTPSKAPQAAQQQRRGTPNAAPAPNRTPVRVGANPTVGSANKPVPNGLANVTSPPTAQPIRSNHGPSPAKARRSSIVKG